jgi:O-antigen ligase
MRRASEFLFLATLFCVTFEKVHWEVGVSLSLADLLTAAFLAVFALDRMSRNDGRLARSAAIVVLFLVAFLLVYLIGFFNLDTHQALTQFTKGMVKFLLHFGFLAAAVALLARRSLGFYWQALAAFAGGLVANAAYGVVQLLAARAGTNLDQLVLSPLTGGASSINLYGAVEGRSIYRTNALTGDPNHFAIMLIVPLLVLTPLYLRLERGHRFKPWLGATLAFLLVLELTTLSRSGLLGLGIGFLVLAIPYRRFLTSWALLVPLGGVAVLLLAYAWVRHDYLSRVIETRLDTGAGGVSTHLGFYEFIPNILSAHPLFGLGLNNFSVYYEFVTGKTNWGPHSYYVALLVETGLIGTILFGAFLYWLFRRLGDARRLGRHLAAVGDRNAARLRPLAWGMTAALVGTLAANSFYLTMQFYYFYVFSALVLTLPVAFARAGTR